MTSRILVHPKADHDLDTQFTYISRDSSEAAFRFLESARATFEQLAEIPDIGSIWEFENPRLAGIRVWRISGFKNHLVFYRALDDRVEIIRVLHGARDIAGLFESDMP